MCVTGVPVQIMYVFDEKFLELMLFLGTVSEFSRKVVRGGLFGRCGRIARPFFGLCGMMIGYLLGVQ